MERELQVVQNSLLEEVAPFEAVSYQLQAEAEKVTISSDKDLLIANDVKKRINAHTKLIKDTRLSITRPVNAVIDQIIGREKELLAPLAAGKSTLERVILDYEAEQERLRREETERINGIVRSIESLYRPGMTESQLTKGRNDANALINSLVGVDRDIPAIKLALLSLSNRFKDRMNDIEIEKQRVAKKKLDDDEARIEREKQALEARKAEMELQKAQLEVDKEAAKAERDRPKSNIVEATEFEIVDEDAVPRQFCSPDLKKIRAWVTDNRVTIKDVPGVRVFTTKKVR